MGKSFCLDKRIFIILIFALPMIVVLLVSLIINSSNLSQSSRASGQQTDRLIIPTSDPDCTKHSCSPGLYCISDDMNPRCGELKGVIRVFDMGEGELMTGEPLKIGTSYSVVLDFNGYGDSRFVEIDCGDFSGFHPATNSVFKCMYNKPDSVYPVKVHYVWTEPFTGRVTDVTLQREMTTGSAVPKT